MLSDLGFCLRDAGAYVGFYEGLQAWGGTGNNWTSSSTHPERYRGPGIDISGEVGYRLKVSGPRGDCRPAPGQWSANYEIVSGTLPPGLSVDDSDLSITGIPTERGNWIVTIRITNIVCDGQPVNDVPYDTEEIRFHIAGTGKVIQ